MEWGCFEAHADILQFIHDHPVPFRGIVFTGSDSTNDLKLPPADKIITRSQSTTLPKKLQGWDAWIFFEKGSELVLVTFSLSQDLQRFAWSWGDPGQSVKRCKAELQSWLEKPDAPPTPYLASDKHESSTPDQRVEELPENEEAYSSRPQKQVFEVPDGLELRDYQNEAIQSWAAAGGQGILAMATGAGKTLTALTLACKVAKRNSPFVLIVICPYVNLALQWVGEMKQFGLRPIECFGSRKRWEDKLRHGYQRLNHGLTDCLSLVVSNATFLSESFQSQIYPNTAHHMLVADEMHNLGAEKLREALPPEIRLRLGLSATPQRHGDEVGTQALMQYFGDIVFRFDLQEAIQREILVPYQYHPILVELTEEESSEYQELTLKIARAWQGDDHEQTPILKALLIRRARLIASAANKLPALKSVLAKRETPLRKAIVYCGDGSMEVEGETERQLTAVTRLMGEEFGLKVRQFTFHESTDEREEILKGLESDRLDAVVAIRCLDEGIDMPDIRVGFLLASSTNPRQFIQRRGRLLRRAPGKDRAEIFDFIVCPPSFGDAFDDEAFNLERRTFARELGRIQEFCQTAENGPQALQSLQELRLEYNLLAT